VEPDDLTLVNRCKEGDQQAFRLLVKRYERKVYAVAFGMLKDREDALDVSQEAFVKVHRYLGDFKGDSSFYTWLYRITRNLAVDRIRSRRGETVGFDENVGQDEAELGEAGFLSTQLGTNPQKSALRRELAEKMNAALQQIPEKHREILVLREVEGMSYEDLSQVLEIPKGTVMSRLFHARAKMQKLLEEYLGGDRPEFGLGEEEG
jgi:RNA polymerase sigma-70 factor, ECF subfamily